jgi:hypothetical protein
MNTKATKIKQLVKVAKPKPTFGTNPLDPWSAKANIAESRLLDQYLKSRGIEPKFLSRDAKVSHAKSNSFKSWAQNHQFEEVQSEDVGHLAMKQGGKTAERASELNKTKSAYKEIKNPPSSLHNRPIKPTVNKEEVEQVNEISKEKLNRYIPAAMASAKKMPTGSREKTNRMMNVIKAQTKHISKQVKDIKKSVAEVSINESVIRSEKVGPYTHELHKTPFGYQAKVFAGGRQIHSDITKQTEKHGIESFNSNIAYMKKHLRIDEQGVAIKKSVAEGGYQDDTQDREENLRYSRSRNPVADAIRKKLNPNQKEQNKEQGVAEGSESTADIDKKIEFHKQGQAAAQYKGSMNKMHAAKIRELVAKKEALKKDVSEDVYQDPLAPTQTVFDGANNTNDVSEKKKQMSKSARMIKSIYKKHKMSEDTYDWEKADKPVSTYGKKPKMDTADKKDSLGENKPKAAAVMSGGTTLTGQKRDNIEIDPMMRVRPGQPDPTKKDEKKDDKKENKKDK